MASNTNISKVDIYSADPDLRYVLGKDGSNPLYVIALNPSVATEEIFDQTVLKAFGLANILGYDGCIIFNLVPPRVKKSENLPNEYDDTHIIKNTEEIVKQIEKSPKATIDILACWGEKLAQKKYLQHSLISIRKELSKKTKLKVSWFCLKDTKRNNVLTNKGHPRHLSFLNETTCLQEFDIEKYVNRHLT